MKENSYKNIVIRMPNWIGDIVMATPVISAIKIKFPEAKLTVMCQYPGSTLLSEDPQIDELFAFKRSKPLFLRRDSSSSITDHLKIGKYDLGILLTNSFSSAWWFYQGGVKERIGYSKFPRNFFLTKKIDKPSKDTPIHQVDEYMKLLEIVGIKNEVRSPKLYLRDDEINEAKNKLLLFGIDFNKKIIGVCSTAAYGSAKCWPKNYFIELLNLASKENKEYQFVFFGESIQFESIEEICSNSKTNCLNLAGKTNLRQLMGLMSHVDLFLTNDSGPMHIAQALNIPILALFGSTSPERTGPYKTEKILIKKASCSPCYKRVCPIDFRCMMNITPKIVFEEIRERLG